MVVEDDEVDKFKVEFLFVVEMLVILVVVVVEDELFELEEEYIGMLFFDVEGEEDWFLRFRKVFLI